MTSSMSHPNSRRPVGTRPAVPVRPDAAYLSRLESSHRALLEALEAVLPLAQAYVASWSNRGPKEHSSKIDAAIIAIAAAKEVQA
mgnify:CR=1 FL=1